MAKEALDRIDQKKKERIFRTAAAEFARHGFHKANINSIAQRAGIGKGSIYLYFKDKRDLYHSTFKEGARIHNRIFEQIEKLSLDPIAKIKKLFEESLRVFPRYQNMLRMYYDLSTSGNEKSLADLARLLEQRSATFFVKVLTEGIASGKIRKDLPVEHAAYVVDCVYMGFFSTLASKYQRERFRVFTDTDISRESQQVDIHLGKILTILEVGIAPPGK